MKKLVFLAFAISSVACGRSREASEGDRMLHAIDELRNAPETAIEQRKALVEQLAQQPATSEAVTKARDACVRAYRPMLEGQALELRVQTAIDAGRAADAVKDLALAQEKIQASAEAMPDCQAASAKLRGLAK